MSDNQPKGLTYGRHKEHTVSVRSIDLSPLHSFSKVVLAIPPLITFSLIHFSVHAKSLF